MVGGMEFNGMSISVATPPAAAAAVALLSGSLALVPLIVVGVVAWFLLRDAHRHLTFPNERRIARLAWQRLAGD